MTTTDNWRTKTLVVGAMVGALIGVATAYLLARTAEESGGGPPQISTGDAIKSAVGIVGLVRGIASLGDR
jgi:L-cystine uptake protein TcyP (sodium:dicarboxylate symporter family)